MTKKKDQQDPADLGTAIQTLCDHLIATLDEPDRDAVLGVLQVIVRRASGESDRVSDLARREAELLQSEAGLEEKETALVAREHSLEGLRRELEEDRQALAEEAGRLDDRQRVLDEDRHELDVRVRETAVRTDDLDGREAALNERALAADVESKEELEGESTLVTMVAQDEGEPTYAERDAVRVSADPAWSEDLDEGWELEVDAPAPSMSEIEAVASDGKSESSLTRRFGPDSAGEGEEVSVVGPKIGPFEAFNDTLADGLQHYLVMEDARPYLCLRLADPKIEDLLGINLDLRLQLHQLETDAVVTMLLVALDGDGERDLVCWLVEPSVETEVLDALARRFEPTLLIFSDDGSPRRELPFQIPREENARVVLEARSAHRDGISVRDWEAAAALVEADDYDRLGAKAHPFGGEVFRQINTAQGVAMAVGVLDYWLQPENSDYVLLTKGFPLGEFDEICGGVLQAAIGWGIDLPNALVNLALKMNLASSASALVEKQLAAFSEVCLGIRASNLDEMKEWENWQGLLERAADHGLGIDVAIHNLAQGSMERVKALVEAAERSETPPPPPPSASGPRLRKYSPPSKSPEVTVELLDIEEEEFLDDGEEESFKDLPTPDLIALLDDDEARQAVVVSLSVRGGDEVARAALRRFVGAKGPVRTATLEVLAGCGEAAEAVVLQAVKGTKKGDQSLDDAVAVLVRAVGKDALVAWTKDRSKKVKGAASRVLGALKEGSTDPNQRRQESVANRLFDGNRKDATP